jgi:hypothetical protein
MPPPRHRTQSKMEDSHHHNNQCQPEAKHRAQGSAVRAESQKEILALRIKLQEVAMFLELSDGCCPQADPSASPCSRPDTRLLFPAAASLPPVCSPLSPHHGKRPSSKSVDATLGGVAPLDESGRQRIDNVLMRHRGLERAASDPGPFMTPEPACAVMRPGGQVVRNVRWSDCGVMPAVWRAFPLDGLPPTSVEGRVAAFCCQRFCGKVQRHRTVQ